MRVWQSGDEVGNTGIGETEWAGTQDLTNFAFDTTVFRPGGPGIRSGKFTGIGFRETITGLALTAGFHRVYFRFAALPSADAAIMGLSDASSAAWASLRLKTTGFVDLRANNAVVATTPFTLLPGDWNICELYVDTEGKVVGSRINGAAWSGLRATPFIPTTLIDRGFQGPNNADPGTTFWYDDAAINSTLGLSNSSWCGPGYVGFFKPAADAATLQWIAQNGGAHFEEVDELPGALDTTSYIKETAGVFGANDQFFVTQLPTGAIITAVLYGIRGMGTGTDSRRAAVQGIDVHGNVLLGNQTIDWNTNSVWKTRYPALTAEEQWNGTHYMLTADYLNNARFQAVRYDAFAREIRFSALWASVDALIPGIVHQNPTLRNTPRTLFEMGPP